MKGLPTLLETSRELGIAATEAAMTPVVKGSIRGGVRPVQLAVDVLTGPPLPLGTFLLFLNLGTNGRHHDLF